MQKVESLLADMRAVAKTCGYAIGVHGSQKRDLDLIAVPWTEQACSADDLVGTLEQELGLVCTRRAVEKPHGRLGYIFHGAVWRGDKGHQPIDLSVMPCRSSVRIDLGA